MQNGNILSNKSFVEAVSEIEEFFVKICGFSLCTVLENSSLKMYLGWQLYWKRRLMWKCLNSYVYLFLKRKKCDKLTLEVIVVKAVATADRAVFMRKMYWNQDYFNVFDVHVFSRQPKQQ